MLRKKRAMTHYPVRTGQRMEGDIDYAEGHLVRRAEMAPMTVVKRKGNLTWGTGWGSSKSIGRRWASILTISARIEVGNAAG